MVRKVLIIEDEPEIQAILAMSLECAGGFKTRVADDGIQGIERALSDPPDLILLDVLMPKLDGYATCARIKQEETLRSIPVIFLTAKCDAGDIEKAMSVGAAGCVAKPFEPLKLPQQILDIALGGKNGDRQPGA